MERFVVSARKYRPQLFDTVVGQESVTSTLKNAIRTKHLASAFLFTGPRGVGKTTCARILARTINCEDLGEDLVPCGKCAPCTTFEEGHSLNVFELDAASNNSVDDIRNLILQVQIAPQVGVKKVYIIDEVHMLSSAAFNAFLKTLEEPPSYAIFILATTEKHKILPTILSRCQVFDFRRITTTDIAKHLGEIAVKEGIDAEPQALHTIAQKADGGLRDALSIFDQLVSFSGHRLTYKDVVQNLNVLDHEHYFRVTSSILKGDLPACLVEYDEILRKGFDGHLFIAGLGKHLRDVLVSQDVRTLPLLEVSDDLAVRYAAQAQEAPRETLYAALDRVAQCDAQYKNSKEPRLLVELTLIALCRLSGVPENTPSARKAVTTEEKKSPDGSGERLKAPVPAPREVSVHVTASMTAEPVMVATMAQSLVSEVLPEKPAPTRPAIKRPGGGFSIKQFQEQANAPTIADVRATSEHALDKPEAMELLPVPEPLLRQLWKDYALTKKREGKISLHATLVSREPSSPGPGRIAFTIVNEIQDRYLREEKGELVGFLRRELGNPGLELEVIKEEITDLRPRYTTKDRFAILAEKNPALLKLRDVLDLDLG